MFLRLLTVTTVAGLLLVGCSASPSRSQPGGGSAASFASAASSPHGSIDPTSFGTTVDNPYLSFIPGTTLVYEGTRDGQTQRDEVVVTDRTRMIMGVACVVVLDTATHDGALLEKTEDWYAQDHAGNVWYFGEATATYDEQGNVDSTEGSWEGGVDGAIPGIVMPAQPAVTDSFRQEFYSGHAEDMFWVVSTNAAAEVPYGSYTDALQSFEWTRLEPEVVDAKLYVAGVGLIREASVSGPEERAELVSVTKP